jgi:hypothetical protein
MSDDSLSWIFMDFPEALQTKLKLNFVALVHKRTIPTERPPLVGEVGSNFCG